MLHFTLFGFPIRIHWLFWLNSALLGGAFSARTPSEMQGVAVWIAMVFLSILIHELGHALVMRRFGQRYDDGGRIARSGTVDSAVLARLMDNPFFAMAAPKSLDRNDFHARATMVEALADADAVATLAAFTIEATVAALDQVPSQPRRWLVTGGGRHNQTFMEGLRRRLGVPVEAVEVVGWNGDHLEAECFGYLAARSTRGLPLSLPTTTGVPHPMPGGRLWQPA
jgi:anhydro-N-acetylmuramic acid kinase